MRETLIMFYIHNREVINSAVRYIVMLAAAPFLLFLGTL